MRRVFIDFGSTYTKAVAFDLESGSLLARVQTPSTVGTDVTEGLRIALEKLRKLSGIGEDEIRGAAACSSAAGGLKMVVTGLVPEYTTKAGNMAALGAGAKVVGTYSYELTSAELSEIDELKPDIALLTGGTDGGNRRTIIHNASALAASSVKNIVAAGNKSVADEIRAIFSGSGKNVLFT
ncbi:MAG: glutamate mutase L, partial [Oscillospiraceae bacterium]|nr:glutamate mutase L [Oscillospiraceae bacterium]